VNEAEELAGDPVTRLVGAGILAPCSCSRLCSVLTDLLPDEFRSLYAPPDKPAPDNWIRVFA
jgi:hypothetical protein